MSEQIINKVSNSSLVSLDLEDWYTEGERTGIDLKENLFQGMILREKDFRTFLKENDWSQYDSKHVYIYCSEDVIIPTWAFMLLATKLADVAGKIVYGNRESLELALFQDKFNEIDFEEYKDARVVVKGCSKYELPESIYVELTNRLMPFVKTLMFGEPCSTVPLYKRR